MDMQQDQELCPQQEQQPCIRLAVLEERVHGLSQGYGDLKDELASLRLAVGQIKESIVSSERAAWARFIGLAMLVVTVAVGIAVWMSQYVLQLAAR